MPKKIRTSTGESIPLGFTLVLLTRSLASCGGEGVVGHHAASPPSCLSNGREKTRFHGKKLQNCIQFA